MHMEWSKDLALGIEAVDEQHRRIMGCINALDDALHQQGPSRNEGIVNVLTDVADCTESHFDCEEEMLENAGYPLLQEHATEHEAFINGMNLYIRRLLAGEDIAVELRDTLERWLVRHIKTDDANFIQHMQKADLQPSLQNDWSDSFWERLLGRARRRSASVGVHAQAEAA